ncbi:MAG TPA: hypothetical protein VFR28_07190 [Allosphingosinicella sp.]|jgi:hypothetical protein|nr:hypothetical protein [Allosphingosinicella sp.]
MRNLAPRLAPVLLALVLTVSGVSLGATQSAPTVPGPVAPFGCYA